MVRHLTLPWFVVLLTRIPLTSANQICEKLVDREERELNGNSRTELFFRKIGALERTRTFTPLGAQPPQGCVSTNSTTSAPEGRTKCKIALSFTSGFFDLTICS